VPAPAPAPVPEAPPVTAQADEVAKELEKKAEKEAAAAIKRAQAEKEKAIKKAQAEKEKAIRKAQAEKEKALKEAQAEKDKAIKEAQAERDKAIKEAQAKEEKAARQIEEDKRRTEEEKEKAVNKVQQAADEVAKIANERLEETKKKEHELEVLKQKAILETQQLAMARQEQAFQETKQDYEKLLAFRMAVENEELERRRQVILERQRSLAAEVAREQIEAEARRNMIQRGEIEARARQAQIQREEIQATETRAVTRDIDSENVESDEYRSMLERLDKMAADVKERHEEARAALIAEEEQDEEAIAKLKAALVGVDQAHFTREEINEMWQKDVDDAQRRLDEANKMWLKDVADAQRRLDEAIRTETEEKRQLQKEKERKQILEDDEAERETKRKTQPVKETKRADNEQFPGESDIAAIIREIHFLEGLLDKVAPDRRLALTGRLGLLRAELNRKMERTEEDRINVLRDYAAKLEKEGKTSEEIIKDLNEIMATNDIFADVVAKVINIYETRIAHDKRKPTVSKAAADPLKEPTVSKAAADPRKEPSVLGKRSTRAGPADTRSTKYARDEDEDDDDEEEKDVEMQVPTEPPAPGSLEVLYDKLEPAVQNKVTQYEKNSLASGLKSAIKSEFDKHKKEGWKDSALLMFLMERFGMNWKPKPTQNAPSTLTEWFWKALNESKKDLTKPKR
jgi:hypothetical protein